MKDTGGIPDNDGWITVARVGKNKGAPRTEAEEKRILLREHKKKKDKVGFLIFIAHWFLVLKQRLKICSCRQTVLYPNS